jgi:nicotinamidase-related amidase/type 1 glutamine amidotransferase
MKTPWLIRLWLLFGFALPLMGHAASGAETFTATARSRVWSGPATNDWSAVETSRALDPRRTAVVLCDMWDQHWCAGATRRVAEMAPRMNDFVKNARQRGMFIIHCPSDTMNFYEGSPGRKLAQAAPPAEPRVALQRWCKLDPAREAPLPIDDSDGGCDDSPLCKTYSAWKQQIPAIEIHDGDAITDSAEAYYLMRTRGITNVLVMGVHLNMCVLGRPFSIRQMVSQGLNVLLVRDLTDTMYNSRKRPWVPHCAGTQLMIEHVEKYWCPTIASTAFLSGEEFRFKEDRRPHIVFLIGEDEYKTWVTLPQFAKEELAWRGLRVSVVQQSEGDLHRFPGLVEAMRDADLLVLSVRRRALPKEQLAAVRAHLEAGKPLLGIRTASHAFAPRPSDAGKGAAWATFDPDVLGGNYTGHHGNGPNTTLSAASGVGTHALLTGVDLPQLTGHGSLYKVSPLKETATPLLTGSIPGQPAEPVAWLNTFGDNKARVFYTSLGHPDDFANAAFRRLLLNAVLTLVDRPLPPAAGK